MMVVAWDCSDMQQQLQYYTSSSAVTEKPLCRLCQFWVAIDWHHDLWPWMTLNRPRCRSRNFGIKYLENGERYDVGLKGGQIGNRPWAFDLDHELWPWMTVNRPSSRSRDFGIKYLEYGERYDVGLKGGQTGNHPWITVYGMQQHWTDTRSIERIYFLFIIELLPFHRTYLFLVHHRIAVSFSWN